MNSSPSPHERAARLKKASALLTTLLNLSVTHEVALLMNDDHWNSAAAIAGVKPPSAETRAIVIADLEKVAKGRAA